jgi:NAD(P)-dependent dehydrogenase (short-subunit alcohol dehydrogenase family)
LTSADEEDNKAAAAFVSEKSGKIDVIIAKAGGFPLLHYPMPSRCDLTLWSVSKGVSTGLTPVSSVSVADMLSDFKINTLGPIVLYQAFANLLAASDAAGGAKFVIISSILAQIEESLPYPYNAYGVSKAGANFLAKKIDQEVPEMISFPIQ